MCICVNDDIRPGMPLASERTPRPKLFTRCSCDEGFGRPFVQHYNAIGEAFDVAYIEVESITVIQFDACSGSHMCKDHITNFAGESSEAAGWAAAKSHFLDKVGMG